MWITRSSHNKGFTLIEILVALVVSALAAIGIYSAFLNTSHVLTQTKTQDNEWQQGRSALSMITQAVESAGYGLPMTDCATVTSGNPNQKGASFTLAPVSAMTPQSPTESTYDPAAAPVNAGVGTDELVTVTGSGYYGSAPTTHIISGPGASTTASVVQVNNPALLAFNDMFLVALPNGSCLVGQITSKTGANPVGFNSGLSNYNLPRGFAALDPTLTASQLQGAGFIDLGSGFSVDQFFISYRQSAGVPQPTSVPSLYMRQYTPLSSGQTSAPAPELVARGVVDMQVELGYGTGGSVAFYASPGGAAPPGANGALMTAANVLAVKVGLLVRSTRTSSGSVPGGIISFMGVNYAIPKGLPANNTMGCLQGNCQQYLYHVFETVIPVRNVIWGQ